MLNIGYISNETNGDVCMYIEEFILLEILLHKLELIYIGKYTGFYTIATIAWAKWEMLLEVLWHTPISRITHAWETVNCEN